MQTENKTRTTFAAAATILGAATAAAADTPAVDQAALDKAFEALKTYNWGPNLKLLVAIDAAVPATHGDAAARKALETRLAAVLSTEAPRGAKDFVCRKLMLVGTAESVPALAALLPDEDLSHMARYALERIPAAEAAAALRDALPKLNGKLKAGVIGSLGVRRDAQSISALAGLIGDADARVASAAATALGDIGTAEAAKALQDSRQAAAAGVKPRVADALLAIAERLLADGNKAEAKSVYQSLLSADEPKSVRLAATRGLLKASGE